MHTRDSLGGIGVQARVSLLYYCVSSVSRSADRRYMCVCVSFESACSSANRGERDALSTGERAGARQRPGVADSIRLCRVRRSVCNWARRARLSCGEARTPAAAPLAPAPRTAPAAASDAPARYVTPRSTGAYGANTGNLPGRVGWQGEGAGVYGPTYFVEGCESRSSVFTSSNTRDEYWNTYLDLFLIFIVYIFWMEYVFFFGI